MYNKRIKAIRIVIELKATIVLVIKLIIIIIKLTIIISIKLIIIIIMMLLYSKVEQVP